MKENFVNIEQVATHIKKLEQRFPVGNIVEININELPKDVLEYFEKKSELYIQPEEYKPRNFHTLFSISKSPDEKTYGAILIKNYGKAGNVRENDIVEELTYTIDTAEDKISGWGEIRFNMSKDPDYFINRPFVGFIETFKEFRGNSLGVDRLKIMNEISLALYNEPLYSGTLMTEPMVRTWEKLIANKEAEKTKEGKHDCYRFKVG
jgi:hypothetical protein